MAKLTQKLSQVGVLDLHRQAAIEHAQHYGVEPLTLVVEVGQYVVALSKRPLGDGRALLEPLSESRAYTFGSGAYVCSKISESQYNGNVLVDCWP